MIIISLTWVNLNYLFGLYSIEVDTTTYATRIIDGDTFDIPDDTVRLADVDTPEQGDFGYTVASNKLERLLEGRKVLLDVDDVYQRDRYGRLVCVVYIDFNSTHYLNVNKALWEYGYAEEWDHPNEFDPYKWTLFTSKLTSQDISKLLFITMGFSIIVLFILHYAIKRGTRLLHKVSTHFSR